MRLSKNMIFSGLAIMSIIPVATFSASAKTTQYPAAHIASPDIYDKIMSNEHVRVLTMTLDPGESDLWHHHPAETVYFLTGGTLTIHLPDGGSVVKKVAEGDVMWHEAWVHRVENKGETTVKAVIVESIEVAPEK